MTTYPYNPPVNPRVWGKFNISGGPRDPNKEYRFLYIKDPTGDIAFSVFAFLDPDGSPDQDDLWWRAECLCNYFNMEPPDDTGGIS